MKTQNKPIRSQLPPARKSSYKLFGGLTALAAGLALLGAQSSAVAQVSDFNAGNDTGWTRYDPGTQLTLLRRAAPVQRSGRLFLPVRWVPDCRRRAVPTAFGAGPARMGSYRNDVNYTNVQVGADITAWDTSLDMAFGLLFRVKNLLSRRHRGLHG